MSLSSWAALAIVLAFTVGNISTEDAVMTWDIQTGDGNYTIPFSMDFFNTFNDCMCNTRTYRCQAFEATNGDLRVSESKPISNDVDELNMYTNEYMCKQLKATASYVQCTRLKKNQCVNASLCWPYQSQGNCELGQLKIFWDPNQTFQMTYNSNEITAQTCDSACATKSTPISPSSSAYSTTETTASSTPLCQGECTTTTTSTKAPSYDGTSLSSTRSSSAISSSSTTPQMDDNTHPKQSEDDDTGIIIGVVVGVVTCVVLVTVALIGIVCWRKRKAQKSEQDENNQLSSLPVEIIHGGFNAFPEHRNSDNGNATSTEYANISASSTIPNGNNASYYNLKHTENSSLAPEYKNAGTNSTPDNHSDEYFRNDGHFGIDNASFSDTSGQAQSPRLSKPKNSHDEDDDNDGMEYEVVKNVPNAFRQANFVNSNRPKINKKPDKISLKPGVCQDSGNKSSFKDDKRYESVNPGGPKLDGVYSEVDELVDNTTTDDIVPPKRHRFLTPPSQTPNQQPSVYELAKPTSEPPVTHDKSYVDNGPYAHLRANESKPVNPYNCEGGTAANDDEDVYDSGSRTYFELESRASIRIKDTDLEQDSDPYYSSTAKNEDSI